MMKLLRSAFKVQPTEDDVLLYQNYLALYDSGLGFETPEDNAIWTYIQEFCRQHNHIPDLSILRGHFSRMKEDQVTDRLEMLGAFPPIYRGNFEKHLEDKANDRRARQVMTALKEASTINATGIEVEQGEGRSKEKVILRGPIDAMRYVMDKAHDIVAPTIGSRLSGEATKDGDDFEAEYDRVKADPLAGLGQMSGLKQIDDALAGTKKFELWTHAAFTGGLKSTFMLNWAYNQAVYYGHDSLVFSLEMPYNQCRRILFSMHSFHERFEPIRLKLGLQEKPGVSTGLPYKAIRDGNLTAAQEKFLKEYVILDFKGKTVVESPKDAQGRSKDPTGGYGQIQIRVPDPDKSDFTVNDLRMEAERTYAESPFRVLFVDHAGLMAPRRWVSNTTDRINEVIRDLKRLAMNFNRGRGMAIVILFQISREGYKAAEKNGGFYNLTHLSYANECCKYSELLRFSDGVRPISTAKVGDRVWSSSGWQMVSAVFDQGVRPIWKVVTDRGSAFECTAEHRVRIIRDEELAWSRVDALSPGDFVVGAKGGVSESPVPLPVPWGITDTLTEELTYLLGAWHGDGRIRPNSLAFTGNRKEIALEHHLIHLLGHLHEGKKAVVYHHPSRPGSFDIELYDTKFMGWFMGIAGSRGKQVPEMVFEAPRSQIYQFLKGLFDTDGGINKIGVISLSSKNEEFLLQVQHLLMMVGIDSYLGTKDTTLKKTGKTYQSWYLNIRGWTSVVQFIEKVGFTPEKKRGRAAARLANPPKRKRSGQVYPVPKLFASLVKDKLPYRLIKEGLIQRSLHNKVKVFLDRGTVAEDTIRYVLSVLDSLGIKDPRADKLRHIVNTWHVMMVAEVRDTGTQDAVWDIEVPGDHEYQSGPLLSHNCERSSDIVTASFVNDDLREKNRCRFQNLKARDDKPFEHFLSRVEWAYRRMLTCYDVDMVKGKPKEEVTPEDPAVAEILDS